jgi:hypothetical protein
MITDDDYPELHTVDDITKHIAELRAMVRNRNIALAMLLERVGGEVRIPDDEALLFEPRYKELIEFRDESTRETVIRVRTRFPAAAVAHNVDDIARKA